MNSKTPKAFRDPESSAILHLIEQHGYLQEEGGITALIKIMNDAEQSGDTITAYRIGLKMGKLLGSVFYEMAFKKPYEIRKKQNGARHNSVTERDKIIVEEMRGKILKRGERKQPSNEAIRTRLAEKFKISLRQMRVITKEFNQKK